MDMSRSGYSEDYGDHDQWGCIMWRGAVASATRGKRGQAFFRDLIAALDALPEKRLIKDSLQEPSGEVCALGALGKARGLDMAPLDPDDPETVSGVFDIATALGREVVFVNDEMGPYKETPEARFIRVRKWAESQLAGAALKAREGRP
jgi:hypothetical protein